MSTDTFLVGISYLGMEFIFRSHAVGTIPYEVQIRAECEWVGVDVHPPVLTRGVRANNIQKVLSDPGYMQKI
jgi:hypothetical protein